MRTPISRSLPVVRALLCAGALAVCGGCNAMNGRVMNQTGMLQYNQGNYTAARHNFQRAVADNPFNATYQHNLAAALKKQGDVGGAEQVYRHALHLDPMHQPSYHGLASLMKEQGRQAEAMQLMTAWVDTQPYNAKSHIELAWLQRDSGDAHGAEQSLRHALQIQPNNPVALAHLGQVYQDTGRHQEAVAMYARSLTNHWNQPQVHSRLAQLAPAARPQAIQRYAAWRPSAAQPAYAMQAPVYGPYATISTHPQAAFATSVTQIGPATYGAPTMVTAAPVLTYAPPVADNTTTAQPAAVASPFFEADPAHSHATSDVPAVQPH